MTVGDNECRDPERLGQGKGLLELRAGGAIKLEVGSNLAVGHTKECGISDVREHGVKTK